MHSFLYKETHAYLILNREFESTDKHAYSQMWASKKNKLDADEPEPVLHYESMYNNHE
jgi:hypothetical protein